MGDNRDIVTRLRERVVFNQRKGQASAVIREAADEIEKLRGERDALQARLDAAEAELGPWRDLAAAYLANLDERSEVVSTATCELLVERLHELAARAAAPRRRRPGRRPMKPDELAALLRDLDEAAKKAEVIYLANAGSYSDFQESHDALMRALRNNLPAIVAFLERLAEAEADADRLADVARHPGTYPWVWSGSEGRVVHGPKLRHVLRLHDATVARRSDQ